MSGPGEVEQRFGGVRVVDVGGSYEIVPGGAKSAEPEHLETKVWGVSGRVRN